MEQIIQLISTHGVGIVCVGYLIYFQSSIMTKMVETLNSINARLSIIEEKMGCYHENSE